MRAAAMLAAICVLGASNETVARPIDAAIKHKIIEQSINTYPGNCPCPYNVDRAGRSCGRRSAYSRPGGYAPKCYPSDVSAADVRAYLQKR